MKTLFTFTLSLIALTVLAAPIECRLTREDCQVRWDAGQDCIVSSDPVHALKYGADPAQCTDAVMTNYTQKEKQKYQDKMGLEAPTSFTDYSTNTPKEAPINPESGFATTTLLTWGGVGAFIIAIIAWLRKRFRK